MSGDAQPALPGLDTDLYAALTAVCGKPSNRFGWTIWPRCPSPDHHGECGPMLKDPRATVWQCVGCHARGDVYDVARLASRSQ